MWRVTWKGLAGHKLRLALTVLAIVLGVSLISGSYVFTDTLDDVFDDLFAGSFTGIDVQVRPEVTANGDTGFAVPGLLDADLTGTIAEVPGVSEVVPTVAGVVSILGPDGTPVGASGPPTIASSWSDVGPLELLDGEPPSADGEVAVDAGTAGDLGLALGDDIEIAYRGGSGTFEVVGFVGFGGTTQLGGMSFLAVDLVTAQRILGVPGQVNAFAVVGEEGTTPEELIAALAPLLPEGAEAVSGETASEDQLATFKEALGFLNTFLLVFGYVSLFVGAFLIQNTFQIMVAQRSRELALLRAIGATRRQVTRMVLGEAAVVGTLGSLLGIGGGVALAALIRLAFETFGGELPAGGFRVLPRTVAVSLAAGLAVTLVSALVPARAAGRVPPVAAMREALAAPADRSLRRRALTGGLVIAAGVASGLVGLLADLPAGIPAVGLVGGGAAVVFIGLGLVSPAFARPLGRTLGAPLSALFGTTGRLARENAVRSPRRTAATASAIMIGIALVGLVTTLAATIEATTDRLIGDTFRADVIVQPAGFVGGGIDPSVGDEIAALPGVRAVSRLRQEPVTVDGRARFLAAADMAALGETIRLDAREGDPAAVAGSGIAVSATRAENDAIGIGDEVTVEYPGSGARTYTVEAVLEESGLGADYYVGLDAWDATHPAVVDSALYIAFDPDADPAAIRTAVEAAAAAAPGTTVLDQTEFRDQAVAQLDTFVRLVYALLAMALVIGFVGIINTLLLSVHERTREIGLLRAIGALRSQIRGMVTGEAAIIAVFGALVGTLVGVAFAWAIVEVLQGDTPLVFRVPVGTLVGAVAVSAGAGVIAAILPARRAARLDVLAAISYE